MQEFYLRGERPGSEEAQAQLKPGGDKITVTRARPHFQTTRCKNNATLSIFSDSN